MKKRMYINLKVILRDKLLTDLRYTTTPTLRRCPVRFFDTQSLASCSPSFSTSFLVGSYGPITPVRIFMPFIFSAMLVALTTLSSARYTLKHGHV
jgi:hypothetical protein